VEDKHVDRLRIVYRKWERLKRHIHLHQVSVEVVQVADQLNREPALEAVPYGVDLAWGGFDMEISARKGLVVDHVGRTCLPVEDVAFVEVDRRVDFPEKVEEDIDLEEDHFVEVCHRRLGRQSHIDRVDKLLLDDLVGLENRRMDSVEEHRFVQDTSGMAEDEPC
jgi:hypothetical protein